MASTSAGIVDDVRHDRDGDARLRGGVRGHRADHRHDGVLEQIGRLLGAVDLRRSSVPPTGS